MASWRVTLPCTKAQAEALGDDLTLFADLDPPPALVTSESDDGSWRLDAYFEEKPGRALIDALRSLAPGSGPMPRPEKVADEDWVTLSQQGLDAVRAGRFFVHTPRDRDSVPPGAVAIEIEAGLAFGTGHHETTRGCLVALDALKRGGRSFSHIADIGTGTGLLALAARRLWPAARTTATDIDPVAIDFARETVRANRVRLGPGPGAIELVVAPGLEHRRIAARAPFDLVIANILAGPLIELAPAIARSLIPGGRLLLAGLLDQQADRVAAAYRRQGCALESRVVIGQWPTLVLRRRAQR